jgi:predicted nuclease of predicted toxin-antitoxin system
VRFKLDEHLPIELLNDLRAAGHEADGLRDEGLIGGPDNVVLDLVRRENRVLLTQGKSAAAAAGPIDRIRAVVRISTVSTLLCVLQRPARAMKRNRRVRRLRNT